MPHFKYLIVGGGMTAGAAIGGIREVDRDGSICMIGADSHPPYDRPPLSKGLWKGKPLDSIWRKFENDGVTLHLGRQAKSLDAENKKVTDDQETLYTYDKLLIATGGTPRRLPFGGDEIIYYRTLDDYERLHALADRGDRFTVIGGGFIGSEVAAALAMNGKKVTMVFPGDAIGSHLYPADLAKFLNDFYRKKGVEVLTGLHVTGGEMRQGKFVLKTSSGQSQDEREIVGDGVVAGIGIQLNVELAIEAGLDVDNGIRVDRGLRTSHPDIYAAGDVANFHNPALDKRLRVEHEDNANTMGQLAGQAMAGQSVTYDYLPSFYSDLFELGFEAVGDLDARLETVVDWKEPYEKGVVYYLLDGRVRGVLLWNVWEQVDSARALIAEPGPFRADDLRGRLPA
ncbi:MAG: FAD-dependent oxidoreductase [Candidatus Hydrogenedentes bacterium]|nr:FAD-dependent oxidoreductase [Candidatus Hydrogenedentota bacterium]